MKSVFQTNVNQEGFFFQTIYDKTNFICFSCQCCICFVFLPSFKENWQRPYFQHCSRPWESQAAQLLLPLQFYSKHGKIKIKIPNKSTASFARKVLTNSPMASKHSWPSCQLITCAYQSILCAGGNTFLLQRYCP